MRRDLRRNSSITQLRDRGAGLRAVELSQLTLKERLGRGPAVASFQMQNPCKTSQRSYERHSERALAPRYGIQAVAAKSRIAAEGEAAAAPGKRFWLGCSGRPFSGLFAFKRGKYTAILKKMEHVFE